MPSEKVYLNPRQTVGIYLSQEEKCLYCRLDLDPETLTVEHVISRFWGGPTHKLWNIALACETCNSLKGILEGGLDLHPSECGVTMIDRLTACFRVMLKEAKGSPVVHNMVIEIKRRLGAMDRYSHEYVPKELERGDSMRRGHLPHGGI